MKPLKFIFVLNEVYPPFRVDTTVLFGEEIAQRGHKIQWVFQAKEHQLKSEMKTWEGGDAWVVKNDARNTIFSKIKKNIMGINRGLAVFGLLKRDDYDFVQIRDLFFVGLISLLAAKINRKRFFFWLSFPIPEMHIYRAKNKYAKHPVIERIKGEFLRFILYKIIAVYADHIFVQSDQMMMDMTRQGVNKKKMSPVRMGISNNMLEHYKTFTKQKGVGEKKRIVYLGTLDQARKLDFLVRVHEKVLKEQLDAELWFIGKGITPEDEKILQAEVRRLGLEDSIVFTGYMPIEEALQHVANADVGLSPYYPTFIYNSTSPTKLIEYMALKCPVVANTHPEQSVILEESRAGLCVPWDEGAFAEAIVYLLRNPDEAGKMGERGCEYVLQNRSYKMIADDLERKYYDLCSK